MRVLGLDPGIESFGFGVLEEERGGIRVLDYGALRTSSHLPVAERLLQLYRELKEVFSRFEPEETAIEHFRGRRVRSALEVGEARGVALLVAAEIGVPVFEYHPSKVKEIVAGYGRGSKFQVQRMIQLQLGLGSAPQPDDAADALAIAFCHLWERKRRA